MALVVVAKYPTPYKSKTRLAAALGGSETHLLAKALLFDTVSTFAGLTVAKDGRTNGISKYVLFAPRSAGDEMRALVNEAGGEDWTLLPMVEADGLMSSQLTVKLQDGLARVRAIVGERCAVAFVGMDSPTLTAEEVSHSLEVAEGAAGRGYIKPAKDNGYVLITLPGGVDGSVFEGVRWSCDATFFSQMRRLCDFGVRVEVGEVGFDIDEVEDLEELCQILKDDEQGKKFKLSKCREEVQKYAKVKRDLRLAKERASWMLGGVAVIGFFLGYIGAK